MTKNSTSKKEKFGAPLGVMIHDKSSEWYHGLKGGYSSTQLKDLLDDEEVFFKKHISREIVKETIGAFDVGTYFHTAVLEPHKIEIDCVVFDGMRRGHKWDAFRAKHEGKAILNKAQHQQSLGLVKVVQDSPVAMEYVAAGTPEVSVFNLIRIVGKEIYAVEKKMRLDVHFGWLPCKKVPEKGIDVIIKVRCDTHADDWIMDLKSTTGNAKDKRTIKDRISKYNYDLSAALYLDMFSLACDTPKTEFIWTFASKDFFNCRNYRASKKNKIVGRAKYKKCLVRLGEGIQTNWQFADFLDTIEPNYYEEEFLEESVVDSL